MALWGCPATLSKGAIFLGQPVISQLLNKWSMTITRERERGGGYPRLLKRCLMRHKGSTKDGSVFTLTRSWGNLPATLGGGGEETADSSDTCNPTYATLKGIKRLWHKKICGNISTTTTTARQEMNSKNNMPNSLSNTCQERKGQPRTQGCHLPWTWGQPSQVEKIQVLQAPTGNSTTGTNWVQHWNPGQNHAGVDKKTALWINTMYSVHVVGKISSRLQCNNNRQACIEKLVQ